MIPKAKIKYLKSLQLKKYRKQEQCFVVEGAKSVLELLRSDFEVLWVGATPSFEDSFGSWTQKRKVDLSIASETELAQAGTFQSNDAAVAIARMKENTLLSLRENEYALVLDDIRDPGNLGTIIRTADWYGISKIIASEETTDFYNPKVISASMGSFTRVKMYYTKLEQYLASSKLPVYGTFLEGTDIHKVNFNNSGFIVMGNESNGISKSVEASVTTKITIPRRGHAESLNAAIATAIVLDNLDRSKK